MHKATILDNIKKWKVFEDDEQMKRLFTMVDEYAIMNIDSDGDEE
jgi:hypothetical protein